MPVRLRKQLELKKFASKPRTRFQGCAAVAVPRDPPRGVSLAIFVGNRRVANCCGLRYETEMLETRRVCLRAISEAQGHSLDTIMLDRSNRREGYE